MIFDFWLVCLFGFWSLFVDVSICSIPTKWSSDTLSADAKQKRFENLKSGWRSILIPMLIRDLCWRGSAWFIQCTSEWLRRIVHHHLSSWCVNNIIIYPHIKFVNRLLLTPQSPKPKYPSYPSLTWPDQRLPQSYRLPPCWLHHPIFLLLRFLLSAFMDSSPHSKPNWTTVLCTMGQMSNL